MAEFDAPLVSVIIPVFNDGEQLKLCLAALAQQSHTAIADRNHRSGQLMG
jgi:hypothetical protein